VEDERESMGVMGFLTVVFKYKAKMLIIFFTIVAAVTAASFLMPPVYEARSTLLVKIGREYTYRPEVGSGTPLSVSPPNQEQIINSEIQVLQSHGLIEEVIRKIGVEKLYQDTPIDLAVLGFEENLIVNAVPVSNVIEITYRHGNPRMAAKAVNLLVDLFKEKHLQVHRDPKSSFIDQQLEEYRKRLKWSEDALQQFKQQNRVYALEEQRRLLLEQRMQTDSAFKQTLTSTTELRQRLSTLNEKAGSMSNYRSPERDQAINDANLKTVFQDLEKERIKTDADLRSQREKGESLKHQLVQMDAEIGKLDLAEKQLLDLKRVFAENEKNYKIYLDKSEDARIAEDMNRLKLANISTIQAASVPIRPIKPRKLLNIALSVVLGAVAALAFAFFSKHSSQSLTSPKDAETYLKLPVLAAVSEERGA
jgi:uncharacterized protein involved in exopolysaccharide biosynthesis